MGFELSNVSDMAVSLASSGVSPAKIRVKRSRCFGSNLGYKQVSFCSWIWQASGNSLFTVVEAGSKSVNSTVSMACSCEVLRRVYRNETLPASSRARLNTVTSGGRRSASSTGLTLIQKLASNGTMMIARTINKVGANKLKANQLSRCLRVRCLNIN